jgi:hypothetical protein
MLNRRKVITFEKFERSYYRVPDCEPIVGFCDRCSQNVSWLTPIQATALTGLTLREVFRRVEAKALHFTESTPGLIHICPNSLLVK